MSVMLCIYLSKIKYVQTYYTKKSIETFDLYNNVHLFELPNIKEVFDSGIANITGKLIVCIFTIKEIISRDEEMKYMYNNLEEKNINYATC